MDSLFANANSHIIDERTGQYFSHSDYDDLGMPEGLEKTHTVSKWRFNLVFVDDIEFA